MNYHVLRYYRRGLMEKCCDTHNLIFLFFFSFHIPRGGLPQKSYYPNTYSAWAVVAASGQILKRGHELARVLAFFDKKLRVVGN